MAVDYQTVTSTTEPSAVLKPYLQYGLSEAQRLYQAGGTPVVGPSDITTQQAMQAAQNRAMQGSPLLGAAQTQKLGTVQGDYLSGNPFFQGAFQPAAQQATSAFNQAIGNIGSQASRAGRYGSGAMGDLQTTSGWSIGAKPDEYCWTVGISELCPRACASRGGGYWCAPNGGG
jgi:hypothetical protein